MRLELEGKSPLMRGCQKCAGRIRNFFPFNNPEKKAQKHENISCAKQFGCLYTRSCLGISLIIVTYVRAKSHFSINRKKPKTSVFAQGKVAQTHNFHDK